MGSIQGEDEHSSQLSEGEFSFGEDEEDDDLSYSSEEAIDADRRTTKSILGSTAYTISTNGSAFVLDDEHFGQPRGIPDHLKDGCDFVNGAPSNTSSPLPDAKDISHSGWILARMSIRDKIMRKWMKCFWVTYGYKLLLFRSTDDFDEWLSNPHLTKRQRNRLIKFGVDFVLDYYHDIHMLGYQVSNQRTKKFPRKQMILHQFNFEKRMVFGTLISANFASTDLEEVTTLHVMLSEFAHKLRQISNMKPSCPAIEQAIS